MNVTEKPMNKLLERAAALEPTRFHPDIITGRMVVVANASGHYAKRDPGALLAGTIEAIEARGWTWSVGSHEERSYFAIIQPRVMVTHGDSPAHALLAGFVATLEEESVRVAPGQQEARRVLAGLGETQEAEQSTGETQAAEGGNGD